MPRRHAALVALAVLAAAPAVAAPAPAGRVYACPDRPDAGGAGWWSGRRPGGDPGAAPARGPASGVEVVAGRRGAEGGAFPPILKPDNPDGSWSLAGETGGLLLVCRFGTAGVYAATAIPDGVTACRLHRSAGRTGRIIGLLCR
jgi:hypothetical protein